MSDTQIFEFVPGSIEDLELDRDDPLHGELLKINMGPQHPATHGVLRLMMELDGETIRWGVEHYGPRLKEKAERLHLLQQRPWKRYLGQVHGLVGLFFGCFRHLI